MSTYDERSNEAQQEIKRKSIKPGVYVKWENRKVRRVGAKAIAIALAFLSFVSGAIGFNVKNTVAEFEYNAELREYLSQYDNAMMATGARYGVAPYGANDFAYNERILAAEIASSGNPELELFNVFDDIQGAKIGEELKEENLDRIVRELNYLSLSDADKVRLKDLLGFKSWDSLICARGCSVDGEASNALYYEYIKELTDITMKQEQMEVTFGMGDANE